MCERRQRLSSNCPICDEKNEDTNHILRCSDPKVKSLRNDLLKEMKCWMNSIDTHPDIIAFVISGLSSWLSSANDFHLDVTVDHDMLLAFKIQINLGWESFLLGMVAKQIIQQQQSYYSSIQSRKTGTRWGIRLIGKLWLFIQQLWIHRNNILHETTSIDMLSGKEQLSEAISSEYIQGLQDLPHVYASYFLIPLHLLLMKPIKFQKQWFLIIRSGRESNTIIPPTDNFSTDTALRNWVGLSPSISSS